MIDIGINVGNAIYNEFQEKGLDGVEAVDEFWEYFGELEVGLTQRKKDGTIVRTKLKDIISKSEDVRKFKVDIRIADEKFRKDANDRQTRKDQETIQNRIKEFGVNNIVEMDKLANEFPDQFEDFLEPIIESQAVERDTWFFDFETDVSEVYSMIFIQRLSVLEKASEKLKSKGYYNRSHGNYQVNEILQNRKKLFRRLQWQQLKKQA